MSDLVYIIVPAHNEGKVIKGVIEEVYKSYPHIVCVDDGSNDNTASAISKTKAHLIKHPINLGQGAALQTGIEYALLDPAARYFVTFDADGQHDIKEVPKMLDELKNSKCDIVLGSRFLEKHSSSKVPIKKRILLRMALWFTVLTSGLKLADTHNGLRVFNRDTAEVIDITLPDMAHASEIFTIIRQKKLRYKEVPVTIHYSDYSMAKGQSMFNAINIIFDLIAKGKK